MDSTGLASTAELAVVKANGRGGRGDQGRGISLVEEACVELLVDRPWSIDAGAVSHKV